MVQLCLRLEERYNIITCDDIKMVSMARSAIFGQVGVLRTPAEPPITTWRGRLNFIQF